MDTNRRALLALLVVGIVASLAPGSSAGAQALPPLTVEVDPSSAAPGDVVTAKGDGFAPTGELALYLDAVVIGTELHSMPLVASSFEIDVVVPSVPAGRHQLIACREPQPSGRCREVVRTPLDVTRPVPTTTTPPPPTTVPPPPPPPTVPPVVVGDPPPSTVPPGPGGVAVTSTTVEGSPPAPSGPQGFTATTTRDRPGQLAGNLTGDIANLAIADVEVTQGLQNLDNEFPLVANRRTTVRVFGTSEDPEGQGFVGAAVAGYRHEGDDLVPLGVAFSSNLATFDDTAVHRSTHEHSPYVELPWTWAKGTVTLRVWVFAHEVLAENEPDTTDNLREVTVSFPTAGPVHLWYWPLYLTEDYDPDGEPVIWTPEDGYWQEHLFTYRLWPVTALTPHPRYTVVGDESSDWDLEEAPSAPNLVMKEMWHEADLDGLNQYVGMVDPVFEPITTFSGLAGGGGGVASWTTMGVDSSRPWYHVSGATLAHEGGHAFGLKHAPCANKFLATEPVELMGGDVDPLFPGAYGWPDCSLAPTDVRGFYGLDVNWELGDAAGPTILVNEPGLSQSAYPFMGYESPGWLDPWHGCALLDAFGVECTQDEVLPIDTSGPNHGSIPPSAAGGIPAFDCSDPLSGVDLCQIAPNPSKDPTAAPPEPDPEGGDWLISGHVVPGTFDGRLLRAVDLERDPERPPAGPADGLTGDPFAGGPYVLAVVDDTDTALWATTIDVRGHDATDEPAEVSFVERAPRFDEATRVVLVSPDGLIDELTASPNPPELSITEAVVDEALHVSVEAHDADGDQVWTSASYRPSADAPWTPVLPMTGSRSVDIDLRDLVGSDEGELRVRATDGYHTVVEVAGGLAIPDQAPLVQILSPGPDLSRPAGRPIDLVAVALDNEDGELGDDAVRWSSDLDGPLGTGTMLAVDDLAEGSHVVTVVVVDSAGQESEAEVLLDVTPTDLPDPSLVAALSAHLDLGGAGAPASSGWTQWRTASLALAVGSLGVAALVLRRRRTA